MELYTFLAGRASELIFALGDHVAWFIVLLDLLLHYKPQVLKWTLGW